MNYQSHFGVYAIISDKSREKILLIKKVLGCYTGLYDLPGGGMEPHELLEETLHREVFEETGCTVIRAKHLCTHSVLYPFRKDGKDITLRHIGAIYTAVITGAPRATSDGTDDSAGCVWVRWKEISEKNASPLVLKAVNRLPENIRQKTETETVRRQKDPVLMFQRSIGIGKATAIDLIALGIKTDKQLAKQNPKLLSDRIRKLHGKPPKGVVRLRIASVIEDLQAYKKERGYYPSDPFK